MLDFNLPLGKKASLFPEKEINYNVSGLFICTELIFKLVTIIEDKFEYRLPIKYIFGSPSVKWNGGRCILKDMDKLEDFKFIEKEIENTIKREIIPVFTFSNTFLTEKDLFDERCNIVLKLINDLGAEVIVASSILEQYIRELYPKIKIHASVILSTFEKDRNLDFYERLSSNFHNYVVHPDDNFNYKLLQELPKVNAEILVNEKCKYLCQIRKEHYKSISVEQIELIEGNYSDKRFLNSCNMIPEIKQSVTKERNISLTREEVKKIISLGYSSLKIQGRTDNLYTYFFDLLRFTLEKEVAFPTVYSLFCGYIENFLKRKKV